MQMVYSDVYMLDDEMKWKELPPMPKPDSHIEFAWTNVNNSIIIAGGTTEKHPINKRMTLVGEVFRFNLETLVHIVPYTFFVLFENTIHESRGSWENVVLGFSYQHPVVCNVVFSLFLVFLKFCS